ncbi:unnamed protein product [Umbelopsis ramanniana]
MKLSLLTSALLLAGYATAAPFQTTSPTLAPLYTNTETDTIPESYIVVLKDHVDEARAAAHCGWVSSFHNDDPLATSLLDPTVAAGIKHTFNLPTVAGYSGKFSDLTLERIRSSPDVAYVERDSMVYASELQRNAPWGLARISHREPLSLKTFSKYSYDPEGGEGVKVYVIDTGINVEHVDFNGRATWGATIPDNDEDEDGNGHGSHCAGTIAGKRYGVAKKANPVAVKVLRSSGSGTMSDVVKGVDWSVEQHKLDESKAAKAGKKYKGAVANMSLGGGKSRALDAAVDGAVEEGVFFAVAAGNDNRDACDYSPAASANALTVGASTVDDDRAYFSNYGKCVDVFAPGLNIQSIYRGSKYATATLSGTSMASPHVAGLAAYFLSLSEVELTAKELKEKILELATEGVFDSLPKDTPNLLIFNDATTDDEDQLYK